MRLTSGVGLTKEIYRRILFITSTSDGHSQAGGQGNGGETGIQYLTALGASPENPFATAG